MTDAAAPTSVPQVRVCAEPGCDRTNPPYKFPALGMCQRSLRRHYRGRLGLPPNPALAHLKAAYQRAIDARQPETDALDHFTAIVRLAYGVGGLSTYQIADATGYQPGQRTGWSPMAIHGRLLPEQRRTRGQVGIGRTPTPEVVAEWTPQIHGANEQIDAAREQRAEAWQTFLELLGEVTAERRRHWNGLRVVGAALGVSHTQVQDWLHPTAEAELGRCQGRRTGSRGDGRRCQAGARRGYRTCWRHADQEPGGGR